VSQKHCVFDIHTYIFATFMPNKKAPITGGLVAYNSL